MTQKGHVGAYAEYNVAPEGIDGAAASPLPRVAVGRDLRE